MGVEVQDTCRGQQAEVKGDIIQDGTVVVPPDGAASVVRFNEREGNV
jgi:hypothetical protein